MKFQTNWKGWGKPEIIHSRHLAHIGVLCMFCVLRACAFIKSYLFMI